MVTDDGGKQTTASATAKATVKATAKATADPCGMTARKAKAVVRVR
jgi:hypothetical protein